MVAGGIESCKDTLLEVEIRKGICRRRGNNHSVVAQFSSLQAGNAFPARLFPVLLLRIEVGIGKRF